MALDQHSVRPGKTMPGSTGSGSCWKLGSGWEGGRVTLHNTGGTLEGLVPLGRESERP